MSAVPNDSVINIEEGPPAAASRDHTFDSEVYSLTYNVSDVALDPRECLAICPEPIVDPQDEEDPPDWCHVSCFEPATLALCLCDLPLL